MSKRLQGLARRKALLISECALQRDAIARHCNEARLAFNIKAVARSLARVLSAHPIFTAGISGLLVSGYAGKLSRGLGELLKMWRLALPVLSWWSKPRSRP